MFGFSLCPVSLRACVGLYQFNVVVPNVSDSDAVPLTFNLGGVQGSQTLYTTVKR